jgi:hypothetical protein
MVLTDDQEDRLFSLLVELRGGEYYDDPNGPWGNECIICRARSKNPSLPPLHEEDCEVVMLLNSLDWRE